jgi:hypothetical protein
MTKFKSAQSKTLSHKDAALLGSVITRVFNGSVSPEQLVDYSRDQSAPTHKLFDWNDKRAANKYRLHQARQYISYVVVDSPQPVRAFHNVYVEAVDSRRYVALEKARRAPDLWEQVLAQALREASSWAARYERYRQLAPIVQAIKQVRKKHG